MNFDMRAFAADLCRFASTAGEEAAAADFVEGELDALGFETYAWDADPEPRRSPLLPGRHRRVGRGGPTKRRGRARARREQQRQPETTPPRSL